VESIYVKDGWAAVSFFVSLHVILFAVLLDSRNWSPVLCAHWIGGPVAPVVVPVTRADGLYCFFIINT
jgi:hypothetical protein